MTWSPWRAFDWNLRSCGLHGHATYRPDESSLAERLVTTTAVGQAYRCLRCADFVVGEPAACGPADQAPIVLRGGALRDAVILRLLAFERLVRGLLLLALAYGVWRFNGSRDALDRVFHSYLPLVRPIADRLGVDLQNTGPAHLIQQALTARHTTITLVGFGVLGYGLLELTEGVGLWLMRRWGEYVAVVGTAVFVPLEVYELVEKVTVLRLFALALNLFAVAYITWTKRLFGVHGGRSAFDAERRGMSLIEVEQASLAHERGTQLDRSQLERPQRAASRRGP